MKNKPLIFLSLLALTLAPAGAAVRYVNIANPSPAPPYTTWANAATNIQDAVDVANAGDDIVVTNGVYAFDGRAGKMCRQGSSFLLYGSPGNPSATGKALPCAEPNH